MRSSHLKVFSAVCALALLIAVPVFSEDAGSTSAPAPAKETPVAAPAAAPVPEALPQAKETAIYGEVQSVDAAVNTLAVQYYDYDSDSEKTSDIAISVDTKLENAPTLGDIKKGDWVDVTYIVKDGKNVAKVVTVEKEETPAPDEAPAQAASPESVPQER